MPDQKVKIPLFLSSGFICWGTHLMNESWQKLICDPFTRQMDSFCPRSNNLPLELGITSAPSLLSVTLMSNLECIKVQYSTQQEPNDAVCVCVCGGYSRTSLVSSLEFCLPDRQGQNHWQRVCSWRTLFLKQSDRNGSKSFIIFNTFHNLLKHQKPRGRQLVFRSCEVLCVIKVGHTSCPGCPVGVFRQFPIMRVQVTGTSKKRFW